MAKSKLRKAGVIDIGSSSIRLIIGEKKKESVKILELLKNVLPLGRDTFDSDTISQETINATISILNKYRKVLDDYKVDNIRTIATTAVREARNKDIFLDTVSRKTGFQIEVLSVGDTVFYIDSFLYYTLQDQYPIHDKNILIAEMGAGTLDVSVMQKGFMLISVGLPIGTLRLKKLASSLTGSTEEISIAIDDFIYTEFKSLSQYMPDIEIDDIIIIDENFTTFLDCLLPGKTWEKDFFSFPREDAENLFKKCEHVSPDELVRDFRMDLDLAEETDMSVHILRAFFSYFSTDSIKVVETSLHYALLTNMLFGYGLPKKRNILDHLISFVQTVVRHFGIDLQHAQHIAFMANELFTSLRSQLGLKKTDLRYLILAAYLHDLGKTISNRSHHKHSLYLINTLSLFRMSEQDVSLIANIARYHRKSVPNMSHTGFTSLPQKSQILVQKLASLLRIADAMDRSHRQKIHGIEISEQEENRIILKVNAEDPIPLEKMSFDIKKGMFEDITGCTIELKVRKKW